MQCSLCPTVAVPEDSSPAYLAKWEQVEVRTYRGGSLSLLVALACPACCKKLVPGSVALSFKPSTEEQS